MCCYLCVLVCMTRILGYPHHKPDLWSRYGRLSLFMSIRKLSIRGSRIPWPNTYTHALNHSKTITSLRTCMHAIIRSPGVWNQTWNMHIWKPTVVSARGNHKSSRFPPHSGTLHFGKPTVVSARGNHKSSRFPPPSETLRLWVAPGQALALQPPRPSRYYYECIYHHYYHHYYHYVNNISTYYQ